MDDDRDSWTVTTQGLAAIATTDFEMGKSKAEVHDEVVAWWQRLGAPQGAFAAAADEVRRQPQPLDESADKAERMGQIREMLGAASPESQLVAAIGAAELLNELAVEFG